MGDFFYYGQKDTIRRLNELAGRGAVVASYAPAVGRSPLGGPNGYMNPAWLDPNLPIHSNVPLSVGAADAIKYGYSFLHQGGGQSLYKIATLRNFASEGTYSALRIDGVIGGWLGTSLTNIKITLGSRGTGNLSVDWSADKPVPTEVNFVAYKEADGSFSVYLFFLGGSFAQAYFNLLGGGCNTYTSPVEVNTVPGELAFYTADVPGSQTYIAPRMQGTAGKSSGVQATMFYDTVFVGQSGAVNNSYISSPVGSSADQEEMLRLGVAGYPGYAYPGHFGFLTSPGNVLYTQGYKLDLKAWDSGSGNWTPTLLSIKGNGAVYMPLLKAGSTDPSTLRHNISRGTAEGDEILYVGLTSNAAPSFAVSASSGTAGWNSAVSVVYAGKNSTTNRSGAFEGTINTSGNDYAEYIFKSLNCGIVIAGQIVGITAGNKVTDKWADAVMFSIKSTAPSFVGGDTWANDVGPRPSAQAGAAPTQPLRREDVVTQQPVPGTNPLEYEDVVTEPGDTDEEWAEKQAAHTAALAAHNIAVQQDAEAMATFDAALEVERQKVDRIAIAGRVPVNVQGAQPGDYIVPVQDGTGIKGIAVHEDDLSMKQYFRAVGRVISIEPDGRAYVMVKVV
jgi:hypothetical protein